jgi:hypothetical protein
LSTKILYESGNTVKLFCDFHDENGDLVDPNPIQLITYDYKHVQLQVFTTQIVRLSIGKYMMAYVTPISPTKTFIYYEWNGSISGSISLKRGQIETDFLVKA